MKYLRHPSPGKPLTQLNEETVYPRRGRAQRKESTFIWTRGGSLPRAERGEEAVLVEDFNIRETRFPQQVELEHQRARRILFGDVGENVIAIGCVRKTREVLAVAFPHERLHARVGVFDQ